MSTKSHKNDDTGGANGEVAGSDLAHLLSPNLPGFTVNGLEFIRLGKEVAPQAGLPGDRDLVERALNMGCPDEVARQTGVRESEMMVRLVQLRVGPLGRIRPAADLPSAHPFEDVPVGPPKIPVPVRQPPVLSLAARALGGSLQRLGDRLYVAGRETSLPEIVRSAREKGVRIRYPRLDPLDGAWAGGPSRRDRRLRSQANPWDYF